MKKIATLLVLAVLAASLAGCGRGADAEKAVYYCPMHPTYTSDRPGDCPICNMKLVKREKESPGPRPTDGQAGLPDRQVDTGQGTAGGGNAAPVPEKTLHEVCVEHRCTMKGCPMMVRTDLKPGERLLCPVCGEVISMANGKVVEIAQPSHVAPAAAAPAPVKGKILYYRNPMNPEVTSPVPMKDPMGMDYIPVYEEAPGAQAGAGIYIPEEKQQLIGVRIEPVKKRRLEKIVRATGKIAYDPELFVVQEEFIQAVENQERLKNSPVSDVMDRAKSMTDAARRKLKLLGMSDDQVARLETTRKADRSLYLPGKGEGVWAYLWINEYEIGLVKVGDAVEIAAVAYPGEKFDGKVVAINPVLDPATRANQVRVEVPNRGDYLKPEMFVNAAIHVELGEKLAVPESAVLDTGIRKIVYLSRPGGFLESREVKLGRKAEGYYEVLEGLSEGDSVVSSGNFLVDSESRLKSAADTPPTPGAKQ